MSLKSRRSLKHRSALKVGLLVSHTGPMGLWGTSSIYSACIAAAELNSRGGILGRPIELIHADAGWFPHEAVASAERLLDEGAEAIVAMHASNSRSSVAQIISDRIPYIYAPQHEVGELGRGTIATGGADDLLLLPSIPWMMEQFHARRFFIVGSDYEWPRASAILGGKLIKRLGGEVVGARFPQVGQSACPELLETIKRARPDIVIQLLVGAEAIYFNRAFAAEARLAGVRRLALASDETVLLGSGAEATQGLFVVSHYFSNIRSRANQNFIEQYRTHFGDVAPPANALGQSCYEALHALEGMASTAGLVLPRALRHALSGNMTYRSARTEESVASPDLRRSIFIGQADGLDFRLVGSFQGATASVTCSAD